MESKINYKGNVTVKLVRENKDIRVFKQHNEAFNELFSFITSCLSGNVSLALQPNYVKCFYKENIGQNPPTQESPGDLKSAGAIRCSTTSIKNEGSSVVYTFTIPASSITLGANEVVNVVGLYSSTNRGTNTNSSAIAQLSTNITSSDLTAGTTVVILWELSFSNAQ